MTRFHDFNIIFLHFCSSSNCWRFHHVWIDSNENDSCDFFLRLAHVECWFDSNHSMRVLFHRDKTIIFSGIRRWLTPIFGAELSYIRSIFQFNFWLSHVQYFQQTDGLVELPWKITECADCSRLLIGLYYFQFIADALRFTHHPLLLATQFSHHST